MIGVIPKPDEFPAVEEFFQLFKTPWEPFREGQRYDVVIATVDHIPEVHARLLLIVGSSPKNTDAPMHIALGSRRRRARLNYRGAQLPIYGELLTFCETSTDAPYVTSNAGTAGLREGSNGSRRIRLGYDLFCEVRYLLSTGQPVEYAHIPALDQHVGLVRDCILGAGIPLLEIPPTPEGHDFAVCLTHDIDFVGIRNHKFDHSMWGFLYRSTVGATRNFFRNRLSASRLLQTWRAAASLPFVYLGWAKDFWDPFEWYLRVEKNVPATYFLIPFKGRAGDNLPVPGASRRAAAYDLNDIPQWTARLMREGCEIGVHGIDAWYDEEKGRQELARIAAVTRESDIGIRMHWLAGNSNTASILERAGYTYDSSVGYNDTIGYRNGTVQVFRPLEVKTLLELPLHIQDGALFYPLRLDLSEPEAEQRCQEMIDNAKRYGGVLTLLWHDRSHGPERFWGDFYTKVLKVLQSSNGWFGTAAQIVRWFHKRRGARFERIQTLEGSRTRLCYDGDDEISPALRVRVHRPVATSHDKQIGSAQSTSTDFAWGGATDLDVDSLLLPASVIGANVPTVTLGVPS